MSDNQRDLEAGIRTDLNGQITYGGYLHLDTLLSAQRPLSQREMLSVLSLLQATPNAALNAAIGDEQESLSQRLKSEVLSNASQLGMDPTSTRLDPKDEDAIDLVGMLFDVLLDERDLAGRPRELIGRLVVPFVKVALLDRRMFVQKTHPARRLLNALAEACEGNQGESAAERTLLAKVEEIIHRLVAEFNENLFHKKGVLAAARDNNPAKASSASQFYLAQGKVWTDAGLDSLEKGRLQGRKIPATYREKYKTIGGIPHLDQNYTVYGEIVKGLDMVDKIAAVEKDAKDRPNVDVRMEVTILKKSEVKKLEKEMKQLAAMP